MASKADVDRWRRDVASACPHDDDAWLGFRAREALPALCDMLTRAMALIDGPAYGLCTDAWVALCREWRGEVGDGEST